MLDNWYSKLKKFSLSLTKDIVQFCDKTIAETTFKINKTESFLKWNTNQEEFKVIKSEIQSNDTIAKAILQQRKFKKFNNLKQPKSTIQPTPRQEVKVLEQPKKPLYSDILKCKRSNIAIKRK